MNKIEQLHLKDIQKDKFVRKQLCVNDFGTSNLEKTVASKSAEVTEQIAIEFAEWRDTKLKELNKWILDGVPMGNKFTTKELFDEFLKTKTI